VVVRVVGQRGEADRRLRLEERDHLEGGVEVALGQLARRAAVGDAQHVRQRLVARVREVELAHARVVGDPDDAARDRGGAADQVRLLEDDHRRPGVVGGDRGGEPGGAGADDHDIGFVGELRLHRPD
jgi:hypothetical protein